MGIRFTCPNGHHLHVKRFLAGKRGICPHCSARFDIPLADSGRVEEAPSPPPVRAFPAQDSLGRAALAAETSVGVATKTAVAPSTGMPEAVAIRSREIWYVRPASGGQYGPADTRILRQWIAETRVAPDSLVWREDWADWRRAGDVFTELRQQEAHPAGEGARVLDLPGREPDMPPSGCPPRRAAHRSAKRKSKRLVALLIGVVLVLLALLVFVVLYVGQG